MAACGRGEKGGAAKETAATATSALALAPGPSPALAAAISAAERKSADALPEGAGKAIVRSTCLTCHGAGMIEQQHKDEAAWDKTLTQMQGWGAPLAADQKKELLAYLVANFGPRSGTPNPIRPAP